MEWVIFELLEAVLLVERPRLFIERVNLHCESADFLRQFKNGAQLGAWLGLTPRQNSSGGKNSLGGITKRGDSQMPGRGSFQVSCPVWTSGWADAEPVSTLSAGR